MANTYQCSDGTRVTQKELDRNIRKAKAIKYDDFLSLHGYLYCEECKQNDCVPIDMSHTKSVQECKMNGETELAWSVENIVLRGRECHKKHDNSGLQYTN